MLCLSCSTILCTEWVMLAAQGWTRLRLKSDTFCSERSMMCCLRRPPRRWALCSRNTPPLSFSQHPWNISSNQNAAGPITFKPCTETVSDDDDEQQPAIECGWSLFSCCGGLSPASSWVDTPTVVVRFSTTTSTQKSVCHPSVGGTETTPVSSWWVASRYKLLNSDEGSVGGKLCSIRYEVAVIDVFMVNVF